MEKYAKIIITRKSSFYGCAINFRVEVDGMHIGTLKNGSELVTYATEGLHIVSITNQRGKTENSLSVLVNPDDEAVELYVELNASQHPVISEITPEFDDESDDGVKRKKKSHPILKAVGLVLILIIALSALFPEESEKAPGNATPTPPVEELTDEEKAAEQLEAATKEFLADNYMAAIQICSEITANFPDTSISENMGAYLEEQYAAFPHFSAKDLMSEYDANVVNADEEYTDKVMVVTGTVSSIGKTNNDKNLTVLLNSGTYFSAVQLNFKTSQTEAVAALAEGDTVTAIGKCTGKSGTQLLILDGSNVMIENCYLIR